MNSPQDPAQNLFPSGGFGSRLVLARVESYDYLTDETGGPKLDEYGNGIPSGLLNITLLEKGGSRSKVPFVLPNTGNTMYGGGLPELQSVCVVGFKQMNDPIILGFIPPSYHHLVSTRQTIPNLVPGEVLHQASCPDVDVNGDDNFFRGARVWLDRYGRVRIECQDYDFIAGYVLSDEFTPNVSRLLDPVTGNAIFMRERVGTGYERRVDDKGNVVFRFGKDAHTQVGGDKNTTVSGKETRTANGGWSFTDGRGNEVAISPEGKLQLTAETGTIELYSLGNALEMFGAALSQMIGQNLQTVVTNDEDRVIGGKRETVIKGNDTTTIRTGNLKIETTIGMVELLGKVLARLDGELIYLGAKTLTPLMQNVVLGKGIEPYTGLPLWMLGCTSLTVFAKS